MDNNIDKTMQFDLNVNKEDMTKAILNDVYNALKEKGYKIYILSNYPESLFKKHTEYADFMDDIDGLMVSYMIHKAKPDDAIYKALCDKYNLDKNESIFFDDREENVEGAMEFGIKAVRILSEQVLLDELDKF